ncbi:MAG: DPP IV N-terminal domain-containing protein, partial [Prevotella sp.]|nr:DPP IV N-terminal domain-containing protein [Prevotella sp.]
MALTVSAQTRQSSLKELTLEDLNYGGTNYSKMIPENRWTTWWGDQLIRQELEACYIINKATGKEHVLFTLKKLNQWIGATDSCKVHSLYYVTFPYAKKNLALVQTSAERLLVNFKTGKVTWRQCRKGETHEEWCPTSKAVAFVKDNQLYVTDAQGETRQLTTDGSRNIVYGQSVHRDEFGISKGTFWSPDGQQLAFYRMDQSMVTDYPLVTIPEVDWTPAKGQSRMATPDPIKYPMAGETSHKVTVGVYDLKSGKIIYLKAGDPTNRYFTNIAWSPDGSIIYMFELNRDQNDCRLVSYNAQNGDKIAELYRETDRKYVEPLHPILFLPWNPQEFLMQSRKDGYNHFYLFNTQGKQLKQVTSGKWEVLNFLGFNTKHHSIIIESN